ncbi:hypothetical protein D9M68_42500 [compost metagenome]
MADLNNQVQLLTMTHNEAASKLDYFILGATLAICAYLAQTNPYAELGINEETFLLGSLLVFASSAICGFKRIEATIAVLRLNAMALEEPNLQLRSHYIRTLKDDPAPHRRYVVRNYLLAAGLVCYLATKVWASY